LRDAEACIILAKRNSGNPDEEDGANIMRATAVKNFHPEVRVIIQLLQSYNKVRGKFYTPNSGFDPQNTGWSDMT